MTVQIWCHRERLPLFSLLRDQEKIHLSSVQKEAGIEIMASSSRDCNLDYLETENKAIETVLFAT